MEINNQFPLVVVDDNFEADHDEAQDTDKQSYVTRVDPDLVVTHGLVLVAKIG